MGTLGRLGLGLVLLAATATLAAGQPRPGTAAPDLGGGGLWINSKPLTVEGLRGRVVLVEFWTYG